jgi:hypothetical protein
MSAVASYTPLEQRLAFKNKHEFMPLPNASNSLPIAFSERQSHESSTKSATYGAHHQELQRLRCARGSELFVQR